MPAMPHPGTSYSPHNLGGVTEHRVYATTPRPPAVTVALLALHGYAAWRLWQTDLSLKALRSLSHWDWAAWRGLVSVQSLVLVVYLVILLKISDQLVYGKFPGSQAGNWSCACRPRCPLPRNPGLPLAPRCTRACTDECASTSSGKLLCAFGAARGCARVSACWPNPKRALVPSLPRLLLRPGSGQQVFCF